MTGETVLVASARLDEGMRRLVGEACEHARVRPVFWNAAGPELPPAGPLSPSLLIAALPAGQRTIPEDVASLASQTFHALPLLLLCVESLVRHSVSLQGGRVTLLGQPLTREKVSARIRTAIVGRAVGGESGRDAVGEGQTVRVREFRGREWWAGAIARDPGHAERPADAGDLFPTLCKLGRHGMAGLLPLSQQNPVSAPALHQAAVGLVSAAPSERAGGALEAALGTEAAAVWFSPATFQWAFYAPRPEAEVWVYSPLRVPSPWRFTADRMGAWRTLGAATGDVVVVSAGAGFLPDGGEASLWDVAEGGGPAVLDLLEARLGERDVAGSALIVELR